MDDTPILFLPLTRRVLRNQEFNTPERLNAGRRPPTLCLDGRGQGEGGINNYFHTPPPAGVYPEYHRRGHPLRQGASVKTGASSRRRDLIKPPRNFVAVPLGKGGKVRFMLSGVKNTPSSVEKETSR